jgi:hypothetical protein
MLEIIIVICLGILMVEIAALGEYVSDIKQIMVQLFNVVEVYGEDDQDND